MAVDITGMTPLIQVFNMRTAVAFYRDILGFKLVGDSGNGDDSSWIWLRHNNVDLMLNDQYEPGYVPSAPPPERTRWHKDTCLYFGCPNPDTVYEHLKAKGVECNPPKIALYGMKQLYIRDPDGYGLCFQCPSE
jgi:catechol 2,3-dioxygenase-like lactoylglutathione lyase family enzyme